MFSVAASEFVCLQCIYCMVIMPNIAAERQKKHLMHAIKLEVIKKEEVKGSTGIGKEMGLAESISGPSGRTEIPLRGLHVQSRYQVLS